MKILFVSSGNSKNGILPLIYNQSLSLVERCQSIDHFAIVGKGIRGYLNNVRKLKKIIDTNNYEVIHAHYSLSAYVAVLAGAKPLVVSLMGSDVKAKMRNKVFLWFFHKFFWKVTIVKSEDMKMSLGFRNLKVIPNGVNLSQFSPKEKNDCMKELNWDTSKKHILFAADPGRYEKNFHLAKKALEKLNSTKVELHILKNISNKIVPIYYNAADIILLTSLWEGSPNVIKEAMACNRPTVSCDVGDVRELLHGLAGCYITTHDVDDVSKALALALKFEQSTTGRKRLIDLKLDSVSVADQLIDIYKQVKQN
jgi:glycosyltransferase involved in cell wall biosynthesis